MLATDSHFEFRLRAAAFLDSHFYELAYTLLIQNLERVNFKDTDLFVVLEELRSIVT